MKNLLLIRDICGTLWQQATHIPTTTGAPATATATASSGSGVVETKSGILSLSLSSTDRWIVSTSIDSPSQRLFACSNDHLLIAFDLHSAKVLFVISLRGGGGTDDAGDTIIPLLDATDIIIHTQYLPELEAVAIATNDGVLLTANVVTHSVEEVGNIVGGLSCVSWSPDHELCALATRTNRSILLMTKEWNVIAEVPISGGEEKGAASSGGETNGIISWRGDAQYFVCSSFDAARGTRRLRVYNQQAQLQSASEAFHAVDGKEVSGLPTEGLSSVVSWRPSGSLIASSLLRKIGRAGWKHEVVFFERNGLRHGQFSLGVLGGEGEKYSGVKDISSAINIINNNNNAAISTVPSSSSSSSSTSVAAAVKMSALDRAIEDTKRRDVAAAAAATTAADDDDDNDDAASDNDNDDDDDDNDDDNDGKKSKSSKSSSAPVTSIPSSAQVAAAAAVSVVSSSASESSSLITEERLQVVDMQWNSESDLLAMVVRILGSDDIIVQLWHQNNYHWYLKNAINVTAVPAATDAAGGVRIRFDAENAMRLMIITGSSVRWLEWSWDVQVSDNGSRTAAVIDGARLLLTPLAHVVTPPPMAARTIICTQAINSVSFCSRPFDGGAYNTFGDVGASISCMMDNLTLRLMPCITALPPHLRTKFQVMPELAATSINIRSALEEYGALGQIRLHQWLCHTRDGDGDGDNTSRVDTHTIILVESNNGTSHDSIVELTLEVRHNTSPEILDVFRTAAPSGASIIRLFVRSERNYVAVHIDDGRVLRYIPQCWNDNTTSNAGSGPSLSPLSSLPLPCPCFAVVDLAGKETVIGKDQRGKFYCEQTMLSPQCLSFGLGQQYVAFTVGGEQNAMFFLDKSLTLDQNVSVEFRSDPHSLRYVERGSSIVAIVPGIERPRAVLQMPRGNLETVYPRALTLSSVNVSLSKHEYRTAILTLRANRVDLNLLYDHNPTEFCQNAERFVRDVSDPELINLFLSGLTNEDCTKTQYPRYQALPSILSRGDNDNNNMSDEKPSTNNASANVMSGAPAKKKEGPEFETLAASVALAAARDKESKAPLVAAGVPRAKEMHRKAHAGPKPKQLDDGTPHHRDIRYREKRSDIQLVDESKLVDVHANKTKVNRVCDVIIDVLNRINDGHNHRYLLSLLTAHAMKSPPDLNAALTIIRTIRTRERGGRAAAAPIIALREAPKAQGHGIAPIDDDDDESKSLSTTAGIAGKPMGDDDEDLPVLSISAASSTPAAATSATILGGTSSISGSGGSGSSGGPIFTKPATGGAGGLSGDACLKYIIFLADVNQLFDAALSMYDFDMVMQVAQHSQKDPKEYIPFLSRLQSLSSSPSFQRYSIDVHLKNYSSALTHLHGAINDPSTSIDNSNAWFTLCRQLVTNQGPLLAIAVKLFAPKQIFVEEKESKSSSAAVSSSSDINVLRWRQLMSLYADWLQSRGWHRDAAVAYLTCKDWTKAVACFKEAGEWRSAFVTAVQLKLSSADITKLASEVVVTLIGASRYLEAAHAAMDYLKDLEQAVLLLVRGEEWAECVRLAHLHGRADLLVTNVLPDLQISYGRHREELKSRFKRYAYSTSRLRLVRRNKLLYPRQQHEMLDDRDEELESLVSGVSGRTESSGLSVSGVSISSRSSTSSTVSTASSLFSVEIEQNREMTRDEKNIAKALKRNQRKAIKRPKIKEGSLNEEEALIGEIRSSTPSIKYKEQMSSLIRALIHFEMIDRAVLLQRDFAILLQHVRSEEMKPMPSIANVPIEQSSALSRHWNWPQSAYNRAAPAIMTSSTDLYAGTTAGESLPSIWLIDWLNDVPLIGDTCIPSSLIAELRIIQDKHSQAIIDDERGITAPKVPRKDHHVKKRGPKGTKEEINSDTAAATATWKNDNNNNDDDHDNGLGLFA